MVNSHSFVVKKKGQFLSMLWVSRIIVSYMPSFIRRIPELAWLLAWVRRQEGGTILLVQRCAWIWNPRRRSVVVLAVDEIDCILIVYITCEAFQPEVVFVWVLLEFLAEWFHGARRVLTEVYEVFTYTLKIHDVVVRGDMVLSGLVTPSLDEGIVQ